MDVKFEICTKERCQVHVRDISKEDVSTGYMPESSSGVAMNRFKYSETGLVTVVYIERYDDDKKKIGSVTYSPHDDIANKESVEIPIRFDGVFTIYNVVLPTEEWFKSTLENNPDALMVYDAIYTVDVENSYIYKYVKKDDSGNVSIDSFERSGADAEEVIQRNTEGTTISLDCDTLVSICHLLHCYLSLCQDIFENQGFSKCLDRSDVDDELRYKRDLVMMTLHVIKYLVQYNRLHEAQRIIEEIGGCNGLCTGWYEHAGLKPDCGCGGRPIPCNCKG